MTEQAFDPSLVQQKNVTITFLEMREKPSFVFPQVTDIRFTLVSKPISVSQYRKYYYGVGKEWQWLDRMIMPDEQLSSKISADNVDIYLMHINDQPAGFAEFVKEPDYTEILYFGLFPEFVGRGIGKYFLNWVINHAWSYPSKWIQLNTCSFDHPNAILIYQNAGFKIVRREEHPRNFIASTN